LTRAVTYGGLFFLGYVVVLPVRFSAIAALVIGATLALEFSRAARGEPPTRLADAGFSAFRRVCFALGRGAAVLDGALASRSG
jgi:hypothetical protein